MMNNHVIGICAALLAVAEAGGPEEFADHFIGGSLLQAPERP